MKRLIILAALLSLSAGAARAETVELLDGTKIIGELVHYYNGSLSFSTNEGTIDIDRRNIKSIVFKLPDPRAELSTPERTLQYWRGRMIAGDFGAAVAAYALMYQNQIAAQLDEMSLDEKTAMKRDIERTELKVIEVKIDGKKAVLKVERKKGEKTDTAFLNFVLENQEWKMTP